MGSKLITLSLIMGLAVPALAQETVNCSGSVELAGASLSGNCTDGFCSGFVGESSGSGTLFCSGAGAMANVRVTSYGGSVSGECSGSSFFSSASGGSPEVAGDCSNGGFFEGSAEAPFDSVQGTCSENGPLSGMESGGEVSVNGTCTQP